MFSITVVGFACLQNNHKIVSLIDSYFELKNDKTDDCRVCIYNFVYYPFYHSF
jgi:hypothetical protein